MSIGETIVLGFVITIIMTIVMSIRNWLSPSATQAAKPSEQEEVMPWRKLTVNWTNKEYFNSTRERIVEWKPARGLDYANILLIGMQKAGKSSLVNTINHALMRTMEQPAIARPASKSVTMKYRAHIFEDDDGNSPAFRLCDLRGVEEKDDEEGEFGSTVKKFEELLDGNVKTGQMVDLTGSSSEVSNQAANSAAEFKDQIHGFVLVVDGSRLEVLSGEVKRALHLLQRTAEKRELPFVVVMTKIDVIDEAIGNDLTRVHHSRPISKAVRRAMELLQSDESSIMPVKNYTKEMELDNEIDIIAMLAMDKILLATQAYIKKSVEANISPTKRR